MNKDLVNKTVTISQDRYDEMVEEIETTIGIAIDLTHKLIDADEKRAEDNKRHAKELLFLLLSTGVLVAVILYIL